MYSERLTNPCGWFFGCWYSDANLFTRRVSPTQVYINWDVTCFQWFELSWLYLDISKSELKVLIFRLTQKWTQWIYTVKTCVWSAPPTFRHDFGNIKFKKALLSKKQVAQNLMLCIYSYINKLINLENTFSKCSAESLVKVEGKLP